MVDDTSGASAASNQRMSETTPGRWVLVVDDNADLRRTLRLLLDDICPVREAADGEEALQSVQDERPGLVLLDLSMPGLDGLVVLALLRRRYPSLRVIMLTAEQDLSAAERALSGGADFFLTKPFDPALLKDEVIRCLGLKARGPALERPPWRVAA